MMTRRRRTFGELGLLALLLVLLALLVMTSMAGALFLIRDRVDEMIAGEDMSFNERIRLPINFMLIVLQEMSSLGL
jgi:hypothetical protein